MKKLMFVLIGLSLLVAACGAAGSPANPADAQPTYTALPTYTAYPTFTAVVTETAQPTESVTPASPATLPATPTLAPTLGAVVDQGTPLCNNHGVTAWQNDNMSSGQTYGLAPVGGLSEPCWVVAQTHWKESDGNGNMVEVRGIFAVEPNTVAWIIGYLGGTGWYFSGTEAEVNMNLLQQAAELEARDGKMKTYIVILPRDAEKFPILDHVQTNP